MIEWVKKNFKKILRIVIFVIFVVVVFREYARFDKIFDKESEYVLNTNSMKIHIAGCVSERKMSDKNRKTVKAKAIYVENFGWGKVNRCFPQISNIYFENNAIKLVNLVTKKADYYERIYRYIGKE